MPRTLLSLALLAALGASLQAQDKPAGKDDPVAAELEVAKAKYRAAVEYARNKVLQAFSDEDKRIADDSKLKPDEKIKRLDQLAAERKAFEADGALPTSTALTRAVAAFQAESKPARVACEKAFDAAANKYLATDRDAAKAVLATKAEFFKAAAAERPRPFLRFAGRADHVELDKTRGALDLQKPFTIELWTRWDADAGDRVLYLAGDEAWPGMSEQIPVTAACGWVIRLDKAKDGGKRAVEFSAGASGKGVREWVGVVTPEQAVKPEQWQHVAVCRTTSELRIYWNGKLVAKKPVAGVTLLAAPTNAFLGVRKDSYPNRDFAGDIRAFRISTKALYTDAFIPKAELTHDDATLVLLDFAAADDKQIPDLSGEKHHGTVVGAKLVAPPK
jgi:hypothetical protein